MNEEKIYPNADASEVIANAKKSPIGHFFKQYKKGDFMYMIKKQPFRQRTISAVHEPTKKVFGYIECFLTWDELPFTFDELNKTKTL